MKLFDGIPCEIIDCHIHPAASAGELLAWFEPPVSLEAFVEGLRACGITRACGTCFVETDAPGFARTALSNKAALAFRDRFPEFYLPAIQVDPRYPEDSCRELEQYHAREGVRWVGELAGYFVGYGDAYLPQGASAVYALAQELGTPVNIHCSDVGMVARLCEAFPRLAFVLAHPGSSKDVFLARLDVVARYANLHMDFSGTGITRWGMLRHAVDQAGVEKFLFGTDFPICTPASFVSCVLSENLTDTEREAIFAGNFKRLTHLE